MKKGNRILEKKELAAEVSSAHVESTVMGIQGRSFRRPFGCIDRTVLHGVPELLITGAHFQVVSSLSHQGETHANPSSVEPFIDSRISSFMLGKDLFDSLTFDFCASCQSVSIWEPVPGETKIEFETLYGQPTGWLRKIYSVDSHGWQPEYNPRGNFHRWRNCYTDEVHDEDPTGKPLTPFIIRGICSAMLIRKNIAPTSRQLPNHWKQLIMKFSSVASKTNLRGMGLFSSFRDFMKKNQAPIPVDLRKLSLPVLQAEARDLFPGFEFNSRQEMEKKVSEHYAEDQCVLNILLLENLSSNALFAMMQELGLTMETVESRFDMVELVTQQLLKG